MRRLKVKDSKECLSILRQFIDEDLLSGKTKDIAILVLKQLGKITAGNASPYLLDGVCAGRPRAEGGTV